MARLTETELLICEQLSIPLAEIEIRTSRSSGPGGQHANKTESRVEASFLPHASTALSEAQRRRILEKLGPVVNSISQDARSQLRNREIALLRLGDRIDGALRVRRRRVATKPTKSARAERVRTKRERGETKAMRRKPKIDE